MKKTIKFLLLSIIMIGGFLSPLSVTITNNSNSLNNISVSYNNAYAGKPGADAPPTIGYLECSWWDMACHGINFLQLIAVNVGNVLVAGSAIFMDYFLHHSIQSSSYRNSGFIERGWEILRDITNIVFIFALIYIAFEMVLGIGNKAKERLMKVILVALTINFSLFMSFAIIDVSNVFAHVFYNKITQKEVTYNTEAGTGTEYSTKENVTKVSTSLALAKKINPQQLLTAADKTSKGQRMVIVIMMLVINGALIYVFLSVAFLFLGRTIGLWLSAILAPLAFASITIPKLADQKYIGFKNWLSSLLQMAFMAPIFIFILYLAVQFMNVGIGTNFGSTNFIDKILGLVIPMAAIMVMILVAKKVANSMAGDFAGVISSYVTKGVMAVGGLALGAGAFAARTGLGSLGARAMQSEKFKAFAAKSGKTGAWAMRRANNLQTSSFDFRNSKANALLSKHTGIKLGGGLQTEKGKRQWRDEKAKKKEDQAKEFDTWLSTKKDSHVRDAAGKKRYGIKSYTRWNEKEAELENEARKKRASGGKYEEVKAGEIKDPTKFQVKREKEIETDILKNEKEVNDKIQDRTDARRDVQDLKDKGYNKASNGSKEKTEYDNATNKVDSLSSEINSLNGTIKGLKRDLTDKDGRDTYTVKAGKVVVDGHNKTRRTEENINRQEKQGTVGVRRTGAAIGATIGSLILPIGGSAIGGLIGGGLAEAVSRSPKWKNIFKNSRVDGKESIRDLKGAQYKKEKDNK